MNKEQAEVERRASSGGNAQRRQYDERIEQQMLSLVLRQNPIAQYISLGFAALAIYIIAPYSDLAHLVIWFVILSGCITYRLWLIHRYREPPVDPQGVQTVLRRFHIGLITSGAAWASLIWISATPEPVPVYFIGMMILALMAGAVAAVSMRRSFFLSFTAPMLLSLALFLFVNPVPAGNPSAIMLLLFYVGVVRGANLIGSEVRGYLRLKLRSEDARSDAEEGARLLAEINDELSQRRRLMESLLTIATRPGTSLDARLDEMLEFGCDSLGLRLGIIARIRDDDYFVVNVVDRRDSETPLEPGAHRTLGQTICTHTVRAAEPFHFSNPDEAETRLHPAYKGVRAGAYIGIPIETSDGLFGTLNFSDETPRASFTLAETGFMRLLATWIGNAISEKNAVRSLRAKEQQLTDLTDAMPCGMASVSNDLKYRYVNRVFQHTFNPDGEPLVGRFLKNTHTLGGFTLVQSQFKKALKGKAVEFEYEPPIGKDEIPSVYRVNLLPNTDEDGKIDGCFVLVNDITDDRMLQTELERKASLDPLTLAYNRKFLEETLERIVGDRRRKRPVYVALVDLDDFKRVNDTAGHEAGDVVLKKIASDLKAELRRGDVLARYGGDEFVMLLHCIDEEDLRATCGKLLERVHAEHFEYGGQDFRIGLSIGATRAVFGESLKTLMKRADQAMYAAKRLGKGRLELAKPELVEAVRTR